MKFQKFAPLTKIEEQEDGTLHVFGLVTAETPDLDNEVCDYATTKPLYQKRTVERFNFTSKIAGMTPSLMPMRGQHNSDTAEGAGRSLVCNDAANTIKMGFHVIDAEAVKKWKAGVYVGFSQGGEYVNKWADPVFKGCTRYTADPMEISAVDAPCLPSALVETMKGRTVTLMKAVGVSEEIPLVLPAANELRLERVERQLGSVLELLKEKKTKTVDGVALTADCFAHVGDPEKTDTWKLPIKFPGDEEKTKSHIRNALARFEQTEGMSADEKAKAKKKILAAAKEHGIEASENEKAAVARACAKIAMKKGMYEVGWLGSLIDDLTYLCLQQEFERDQEGDDSKVPEGLREAWTILLEEFKAMALEEAEEYAARGGKGAKGMKITDQAGLSKAAKTIHEHLQKHMEMHKAHHEMIEKHLAKEHPLVKGHQAMMDHCEKCMKAAKDGMDGEESEGEKESADKAAAAAATAGDPIAKAVTAALAPLTAEIEALKAKLAVTPAAQDMPHTGAGQIGAGQIGKTVNVDAAYGELISK